MWKVLSTFLILVGFISVAEAHTFVWKDNVSGFTFSFPDDWTVQTGDSPTTQIRIGGPIGEDFATFGSMVGTIYGDMRYVVSCSSRQDQFQQYERVFGDIMSSVVLDTRYHPFVIGDYRNFLADSNVGVPHLEPVMVHGH
ncbi:MAG: hypothetical protein HY052_01995 [Proteobacteria bacterium]|nr:hypothetical protein [Pseudomonadota bacterium]